MLRFIESISLFHRLFNLYLFSHYNCLFLTQFNLRLVFFLRVILHAIITDFLFLFFLFFTLFLSFLLPYHFKQIIIIKSLLLLFFGLNMFYLINSFQTFFI